MLSSLSAVATRLEKAAVDNGFDCVLLSEAGWLGFASTHAPLRIWLSADDNGAYRVAFSRGNVARALAEHGVALSIALPSGAVAALAVADVPALERLVRRAFQLSKSLPDELLHAFEKQTASLPKTTEAERLVVQRVGQDIFRAGLIDYWGGRCAITGLAVVELLRASHIKPWADCETDAERLDIYNGLLLAPHLDAAFDQGFITVDDDGEVVVSPSMTESDRTILGLMGNLRVGRLGEGHRVYLPWHRAHRFGPRREPQPVSRTQPSDRRGVGAGRK